MNKCIECLWWIISLTVACFFTVKQHILIMSTVWRPYTLGSVMYVKLIIMFHTVGYCQVETIWNQRWERIWSNRLWIGIKWKLFCGSEGIDRSCKLIMPCKIIQVNLVHVTCTVQPTHCNSWVHQRYVKMQLSLGHVLMFVDNAFQYLFFLIPIP